MFQEHPRSIHPTAKFCYFARMKLRMFLYCSVLFFGVSGGPAWADEILLGLGKPTNEGKGWSTVPSQIRSVKNRCMKIKEPQRADGEGVGVLTSGADALWLRRSGANQSEHLYFTRHTAYELLAEPTTTQALEVLEASKPGEEVCVTGTETVYGFPEGSCTRGLCLHNRITVIEARRK